MEWKLKTLGAMRLACVQESGIVDEKVDIIKKAEQKMSDYLITNGLQLATRKYFSEMNINKNNQEFLVYALYAVVENEPQKSKDISIISMERSDYAYAEVSEEDADKYVKEKMRESVAAWLKGNNFKADISKIIFLMETINDKRCFYIPVKRV